MSDTITTNGVCVYCKEPGGHSMRDCPACQDFAETMAALLAHRKILRRLLSPDETYAASCVEDAEKILAWPAQPLP